MLLKKEKLEPIQIFRFLQNFFSEEVQAELFDGVSEVKLDTSSSSRQQELQSFKMFFLVLIVIVLTSL